MSLRVLILGASYGLLPGVRLALAGHRVTLVGKADEVAAMRLAPLRLELRQRRGGDALALSVRPGEGVALVTSSNAAPLANPSAW